MLNSKADKFIPSFFGMTRKEGSTSLQISILVTAKRSQNLQGLTIFYEIFMYKEGNQE